MADTLTFAEELACGVRQAPKAVPLMLIQHGWKSWTHDNEARLRSAEVYHRLRADGGKQQLMQMLLHGPRDDELLMTHRMADAIVRCDVPDIQSVLQLAVRHSHFVAIATWCTAKRRIGKAMRPVDVRAFWRQLAERLRSVEGGFSRANYDEISGIVQFFLFLGSWSFPTNGRDAQSSAATLVDILTAPSEDLLAADTRGELDPPLSVLVLAFATTMRSLGLRNVLVTKHWLEILRDKHGTRLCLDDADRQNWRLSNPDFVVPTERFALRAAGLLEIDIGMRTPGAPSLEPHRGTLKHAVLTVGSSLQPRSRFLLLTVLPDALNFVKGLQSDVVLRHVAEVCLSALVCIAGSEVTDPRLGDEGQLSPSTSFVIDSADRLLSIGFTSGLMERWRWAGDRLEAVGKLLGHVALRDAQRLESAVTGTSPGDSAASTSAQSVDD
jgi:hypothetical protein